MKGLCISDGNQCTLKCTMQLTKRAQSSLLRFPNRSQIPPNPASHLPPGQNLPLRSSLPLMQLAAQPRLAALEQLRLLHIPRRAGQRRVQTAGDQRQVAQGVLEAVALFGESLFAFQFLCRALGTGQCSSQFWSAFIRLNHHLQ